MPTCFTITPLFFALCPPPTSPASPTDTPATNNITLRIHPPYHRIEDEINLLPAAGFTVDVLRRRDGFAVILGQARGATPRASYRPVANRKGVRTCVGSRGGMLRAPSPEAVDYLEPKL